MTPKTTMTGLSESPPDLEAIHDVLGTMRETLAVLGAAFDNLGEQTARVAKMGPAIDTAHQVRLRVFAHCPRAHFFLLFGLSSTSSVARWFAARAMTGGAQHRSPVPAPRKRVPLTLPSQINALRRQLQKQESVQETRMHEIEVLIKDVLKAQIAEHLSGAVRAMVKDGIAKRVEARVAEEVGGDPLLFCYSVLMSAPWQLTKQVPAQLKEQIEDHKKQLEDVRVALHNSYVSALVLFVQGSRCSPMRRLPALISPSHTVCSPGLHSSAVI